MKWTTKIFYLKIVDLLYLEISITKDCQFEVKMCHRNLYKCGITGGKCAVRFKLDFSKKAIILMTKNSREEPIPAERAFDYYFKLKEQQNLFANQ